MNFREQIRETRKKIQDSFKRSHEALRVRENILLSRVEEIETEFNKKTQEMNEMLEALNRVKSVSSDRLKDNKLANARAVVNSLIDDEITKLNQCIYHAIEFEWDPLFESDIEQLGVLSLMVSRTFLSPAPSLLTSNLSSLTTRRNTSLLLTPVRNTQTRKLQENLLA